MKQIPKFQKVAVQHSILSKKPELKLQIRYFTFHDSKWMLLSGKRDRDL